MSGIVFLLAGVLILTLFRRRVAATALFGGVLVLWGAAFVSHMTGSADAAVRSKGTAPIPVTVVQPNVGQADKWEGSKADANFAKLARLPTPRDDAPRRSEEPRVRKECDSRCRTRWAGLHDQTNI